MTGNAYREAAILPGYVCVACFQCSSATEQSCASCGNQMRSLEAADVRDFVLAEARRRVGEVVKRQFVFGAAIALPIFLYLVFISSIGRTAAFILPEFVLLGLIGAHPYLFKKDARIGRKYRRSPKDVAEALDVLGTRIQ